MTKIEQLESELNQKENELDESLYVQYLLRERLRSATKTMEDIENLLKSVAANLTDSNEYIDTLKQENRKLKLSCEVWVKRAVKLEFQVLNARAAAKK
ncbi:MAG: hypothetical protein ACNA7G_06200 [Methylobacter sp.]